jgi:hypothetical protein
VRFVPQKRRLLLQNVLYRPEGIVIAVGAWEDNDAEFHGKIIP